MCEIIREKSGCIGTRGQGEETAHLPKFVLATEEEANGIAVPQTHCTVLQFTPLLRVVHILSTTHNVFEWLVDFALVAVFCFSFCLHQHTNVHTDTHTHTKREFVCEEREIMSKVRNARCVKKNEVSAVNVW
jgi:hypothetical protein